MTAVAPRRFTLSWARNALFARSRPVRLSRNRKRHSGTCVASGEEEEHAISISPARDRPAPRAAQLSRYPAKSRPTRALRHQRRPRDWIRAARDEPPEGATDGV